jgi:NAD(P)-dependent dehydrogenase (short-subunit alcohol dehydrogenase family)
LAHELRADRVTVNAIAPGALNTRMLDEVIAAGPSLIGPERYARALAQKTDGGASLERAAQLAVFLASSASEGITGRLISAVWDPWETLGSHAADIDGTDVYTLRRIVPADRGFDWGDR